MFRLTSSRRNLNAFERDHDMFVLSGTNVHEETRAVTRNHYRFFDDPDAGGRDAAFGLDGLMESLVNALKCIAKGYGAEKRDLLLHGPVGEYDPTAAEARAGALFGQRRRRRRHARPGVGRSQRGLLVPDA